MLNSFLGPEIRTAVAQGQQWRGLRPPASGCITFSASAAWCSQRERTRTTECGLLVEAPRFDFLPISSLFLAKNAKGASEPNQPPQLSAGDVSLSVRCWPCDR
jgi:hypothetical protein